MIDRQRVQQGRVQQDALGQQRGMAEAVLHALEVHYSELRGLRACACRGRDGDVGNPLPTEGIGQRAFRRASQQHGLHALGGIHGGAPADGHQAVAVLLPVDLRTPGTIGKVRVGMEPAEARKVQACPLLKHRGEPVPRYQQRAAHAHRIHHVLQPVEAAPSVPYHLCHACHLCISVPHPRCCVNFSVTKNEPRASRSSYRTSALLLLVLGVLADDHDLALALDDLALFADRLHGRTNLHVLVPPQLMYVVEGAEVGFKHPGKIVIGTSPCLSILHAFP